MAINILMPALSPTMTEGKLAKWVKQEGDEIKSGDVIAEIETDKATMEVEAVDEGFLAKILVPEGTEGVVVNSVIGVITAEKGEKVDAPAASPAPAPAPKAEAAAPPAPVPATTAAPAPTAQGERIFASPLAKRIAKQSGIDLSTIKGSGPNGRIVKADVEGKPAAAPKSEAAPTPAAAPAAKAPAPAPVITAPHTKLPNSTMRKVIARRLTESKQNVPHFYLTVNIELDKLLALRAELNGKSPKDGPGAFKLSVNDLIIKACGIALRRHPNVNASWTDEAIIQYDEVDISVAVAIPDGLITPIVKGADKLGLAAISNNMKDLAGRAKAGKLKPEEFQGGGFSISNLGMFGISDFCAIVNPPQAAILAVGAGERRPVVKDDEIKIATVMSATLSTDHRVVDGAAGAEFLQTLKALIEEPLGLLL
ncbi:pyruvate dehydrogenase complex dihydrolipoamide acetyltransferase [Acidocella aminolytica]|uniref:Acetyltransferase component of pyruvate dehydrogenase complex n=1 Tax=Acidocella aminolytica 101 = DSM 11237 TaxID=1120923 RepID=A0A0D6PG38_9PROT|nr:pyruvate dehydrogenase complex dihydrolipoamide acetyltransferase [Acidocella aminolytica]GAN80168.1 dihydrolipoamide acetyltransferase/pyruvate dehydrogenase E2 component [Acidocella aminolytica 101 = DSM 11237]GBQ33417.1 dihydrolipoamide acetyltransferase component [Acidocella aminolytica 101 = DSM 11237]SHE88315.1 pyruvate dehydrogenase E2 component (dihydrolipoamide acetyltransferase) [Acidocella aminolytica 101 = DSM 11237]